MRRLLTVGTVVMIILALSGFNAVAEEAPGEVHDLANGKLSEIAGSSFIVDAVKAQNARGMTLAAIKEMDEKWKNTAGIADFMQALMESECARELRKIQDADPFYAEIFVMDDQGANVCQTDKTSDYWQGDEDKFVKSFNGGKGSVFVDEVEFDESTQTYISQVSVPVMDGGKAIGAVTFGIDIDNLN